jgi:hypothetical protein
MERKATASTITISSNTNDQTTDQTYQVPELFIAASNPAGNIKMGLGFASPCIIVLSTESTRPRPTALLSPSSDGKP